MRRLPYRLVFAAFVVATMVVTSVALSQTAPNTQIRNQAKAGFQYKTFPADTVVSNSVQFTVLAAPNFEISFGARDSMVFGKETLQVRIVYKNIGNLKADSATVKGILPPSGLRFVPGSTKGSITGGTVTWKVINVEPGQADSVAVRLVVDSTLAANTQLQMEGEINWSSQQATADKIFVVASFPRLDVTNTASVPFVGSGRTVTYEIVVRNTGNVQSNDVTLVDTLSALAAFVSASVSPDSIRNDGKILVWKLGTIPPFGQRMLSVTVQTPPNLVTGEIYNSAFSFATNIAAGAGATVTTPIVPIVPKSIVVTADPKYIFGQANLDSTRIDVILRDSLGLLMPNGVPVQFSATRGRFANNLKSYTSTISDGIASVYLRSETVSNDILPSTITVIGGALVTERVQDSTTVLLYPGAVTGKVVSGLDRKPFAGAIARVYDQQERIVDADTTENDGIFFVPLNKDVMAYRVEIIVVDNFGDTITTRATIDPTQFPRPAIQIPNTISGRIVYKISGTPVPAAGITVYLDSVTSISGRSRMIPRNLLPIGIYSRIGQVQTDELGRFKFENLKPAKYLLSIDSSQIPSFSGFTFVADTISGTFSINLSLEIDQDSTVSYAMRAPATVPAGDTLRYSITINNNGNYHHTNIEVIDTLPSFATLLSTGKGKFKTFAFDTTGSVARWTTDVLEIGHVDSLQISVLLPRNIPDNTVIWNRSWFRSDLLSNVNAAAATVIRSAPVISFGNFFVGKDSIVAGDSVYKRIWFRNTGTDSIKGITIIDSIYFAGKSLIGLAKSSFDSVSVLDSVVTVHVGAIAPGESDTVTVRLLTDFTLATGTTILSSAHLLRNDSSLFNVRTTLKLTENVNISKFLTISKTANKKVGEIGDIVTYQVQIGNNSPAHVHTLGVYDLLPHAFRYIKNSARYNGKPAEPVINQRINSLNWSLPDTVQKGGSGTLVYQLAIGADAMESEGMNTAYASAVTNTGFILVSAASQWQVTVRPGVFTEKGLIIGKVFYDDNRNAFQESGEDGIKNVEIWTEDGTRITTGDDGKYSLPEVRPGQHVLRVNERTLPQGSSLLAGNNKFAKDPASQFVRLTEGGIAKANFFVARTIADSLQQGMAKINKLITVRQAVPKFIYNDTLRNMKIDTVTMHVSFVFSGAKYLQSIEVNEVLPSEMAIVPNSATFNGRRVTPTILGNNVQWRLGRAQEVSQGALQYKVALKSIPRNNTVLITASSVKVMTVDSVVIEGQRLMTENIVREVDKNRIETSDVMTKLVGAEPSALLSDSVAVTEDDEIFFKISLFIDPKKKVRSVRLLDSLEGNFVINERSFSINGIPLPSKNLTVKVRSSLYSSRILEKKEIEFMRIASADLTDLIRKGMNEITYSARLVTTPKDSLLKKTAYVSVVNEFNETILTRSNENKILIRASKKLPALAMENTYVDIPRSITKIEEKIAEARNLIEELQRSGTGSVVMEGITFEAGKSTLTSDAMIVLNSIAGVLKSNVDLHLQINGYTDNTGNAALNRNISLARANEVKNYLVAAGIDQNRLKAQGFGPDKPIESNKTEAGRSKNRRVEFSKIPK
jgi:uncharacterized repeat protein (TIGR01451 family)